MQFKQILFAAAATVLVAGCNNVDYKKTKGGMPYKIFTNGKNPKLKVGQVMKFHFTRKLNDSVMATTYTDGPQYYPVTTQSAPYDISEVILELRKGDSVYAVQAIDTFLRQAKTMNPPPQIPPQFKAGDKMITTIKVLDVFENEQAARADQEQERARAFKNDKKIQDQLRKDNQAIASYLQQNGIQAQQTENGVYYQVLSQGNGPKITKGKFVSLMYKGQTLAGKIFDTNMDTSFKHTDPLNFQVGQGQMLRGFDEAIQQLKKGDKARFFIPSSLAYGAQPPSPEIGPYENLVFDVIVLDVSDQEFARPGMPGGVPGGVPDNH